MNNSIEITLAVGIATYVSLIVLHQLTFAVVAMAVALGAALAQLIRSRAFHVAYRLLMDESKRATQFVEKQKEFLQNGGTWQQWFGSKEFWEQHSRLCESVQDAVDDPEEVRKDVANLGDPFTRNVAMLLQAYGWEVSLGPRSNDYGVDIVALGSDGETRVIVQCKHTASAAKFARDLGGTMGLFGADRAILVTTEMGKSNQLRDFRDHYGLEYWDLDTLVDLASKLHDLRKVGSRDTPSDPRIQCGLVPPRRPADAQLVA